MNELLPGRPVADEPAGRIVGFTRVVVIGGIEEVESVVIEADGRPTRVGLHRASSIEAAHENAACLVRFAALQRRVQAQAEAEATPVEAPDPLVGDGLDIDALLLSEATEF
jgi:hypothetical protein